MSIDGTIRSVQVDEKNGYVLFDVFFDQNYPSLGITVQSDNLTRVPKEGERLWTFGRAFANPRGRVTLVEFVRWKP